MTDSLDVSVDPVLFFESTGRAALSSARVRAVMVVGGLLEPVHLFHLQN
jgi:hypothetical protein